MPSTESFAHDSARTLVRAEYDYPLVISELQQLNKQNEAMLMLWLGVIIITFCFITEFKLQPGEKFVNVVTSDVGFDVLTAATMRNAVFWDLTLCGSCKNWRFGRTYHLHN
jgi:hypothetical protein